MNILEINFQKGWRGGERQTLYNMRGFRNAGVSVHLVCRKGSSIKAIAEKEGFVVHPFYTVLGVIFFLISKGKGYKFIHAQDSQILTYCVFTKAFHRTEVIFTRRVNFFQKGVLTWLKYRLTDRIIAISPTVKKTLEIFSKRKDIEVISDIVVKKTADQSRTNEVIAKLKIEGKRIVGTIAALTHEKDPITHIKAIKKLSEMRDDFVVLHFGAGDLEKLTMEKIREFNLQGIYFMMGFVENVEDFLPLLDVFVMTSREEGLGSSVLDAFVNKVPVVSTNAGGLNDLLQSGERGVICEIGDSDAIARGIDLLLSDRGKKEIYVQKAFEYVSRYHSMEFVTDQYIECMRIISNEG